jgi:hypothetical protein
MSLGAGIIDVGSAYGKWNVCHEYIKSGKDAISNVKAA